jgi:hypothetical protein
MTEMEQLIQAAFQALAENPNMSAWDKAQMCDRIQDMAYAAYQKFCAEDDAESDARWQEMENRMTV